MVLIYGILILQKLSLYWAINLLVYLYIDVYTSILEIKVTRYWIENDQFIVTSGWLNKKKRTKSKRIQSLDTTQGSINQIVGGVSFTN